MKTAVTSGSLPGTVSKKYLDLYVGESNWAKHIDDLFSNAMNKFKDKNLAVEHVKRAISCAVLLPLVKKTSIPDPVSNLLFWCTGWKEFHENDWFDMLLTVIKEDIIISESRNNILSIGVIDPIDVSPITRQAYNWLHDKANSSQIDGIDESLEKKLINLVRAYGGAVICNMFINHKLNIDKVLNWRSGYFFEKQVHKVYSMDQIVKIKTAELNKTNQKYIRKLGASNG